MSEGMQDAHGYYCKTCGESLADIIEIVQHGCEEPLAAPSLSKNERATLMYIESRVVDQRGELDHEQMNYEDQQNIKVFQAAGLLEIEDFSVKVFSDAAWNLARDCRQMRADSWIEGDKDIGDVPGDSE